MNNVHASGVLGWIEQANVPFMHSQAGEPSVCGSFSQDLAGVGIPFNSDNWSVAENEVGEQAAAVAGKEVHGFKLIHATPALMAWLRVVANCHHHQPMQQHQQSD